MIRILAYMPTPGALTGAPRRMLTLASVLKREGIQVCIASQSESELLEAAEAVGHETATVDAVGLLALRHGALLGGGVAFRLRVLTDLLRHNWRLFRCIRARQADVVWIRASKGIAFGAIGVLLSRRPLIWDVDYELPSSGIVRWLHQLGLWASKAAVFQYSAAPEAIFGQRLATRYSAKFRTIIPGIELGPLEQFRMMRTKREKSRERPFVVLQVGSICDRKNQMLVVDALARLQKKELAQAIEVWFAGDTFDVAYEERLQKQLASSGLNEMVRFLGWRSDVHQLMADADVLVVPSKDEGVPNTVQEAMAIGLPVVVSRAGGMPEVVSDGETGWVLDGGDVEAWADRIKWCVEHQKECEAVGDRAQAYARQHFRDQSWGAEYAEIVRELQGFAQRNV